MPTSPEQQPRGRDVSIPIEQIAVKALGLSLVLLIVPILLYGFVWDFGSLFSAFGSLRGALYFLFWLTVFVLAHEGFHAVGWKYWGDLKWKDLRFGIKWEALAPYCHAQAPMQASAYRFGALLPGLATGLLPFFLALVVGNGPIALVSAVMISGAVGDVYVLWIMRDVAADALVMDHPSHAGCIVLDEGSGA